MLVLAAGAVSCSGNEEPDAPEVGGKKEMSFTFAMPSASRATATAFEEGDRIGLFVNDASLPLEISGNTVNNNCLTLSSGSWSPLRRMFWDDGTFNATAYYPYMTSVSSISDLPFSVQLDQSTARNGEELSGLEASDFLFAKAKGLTASASPISMTFRHIMSKLTIRLVKGEDFEGEIPETATVYIHNTVPDATIDLESGVATRNVRSTRHTIRAAQAGPTSYTAILVPQRLDNRVPLIEVVMNGVSFLYESRFVFKPGVHHLVNLIVDKNPDQVKIEIGGEIAGWN